MKSKIKQNSAIKTLAIYCLLFVVSILGAGFVGIAAADPKSTFIAMSGMPILFGITMFETRTMLRALEQMMKPKTFLLDTFFQGPETSDTEYVDIDIFKGKRRMAPFVSPTSPAKVVDRTGFIARSFKPPYISEKMPFRGADLLKRQAGDTIYQAGASPMERAQLQLGKDLLELDDMITRREEWMAAQVLFNGKVRCVGDEVDVTVDFLRDSNLTVALDDLYWKDSDGVPITNLLAWKALVGRLSNIVPDAMLVGADVIIPFLENAQVQKLLDKTKINLGIIEPKDLPAGATYYGRVEGLDIYTYDEWYLDADGVLQPMVPTTKVLLGSTRARCPKMYGAIQDLEATGSVPRFPTSWTEKDPSVRWVKLQSAPIPATLDTDAFLVADVLEAEQ